MKQNLEVKLRPWKPLLKKNTWRRDTSHSSLFSPQPLVVLCPSLWWLEVLLGLKTMAMMKMMGEGAVERRMMELLGADCCVLSLWLLSN